MEKRYKIKTEPTEYPVSLDDVKRNLHIPVADIDADRDDLLQDLIYDAVEASQNNTGRQYCPATYTLYLDEYPDDDLVEIEKGPVISIESVKYYAEGATEMTVVDPADYQLDNAELTARLLFLETFTPDTDRLAPIEIEFTCGYAPVGNQAAPVPYPLKQAVILRACGAYRNPENDAENFGMGRKIRAAEIKERDYKVQRY